MSSQSNNEELQGIADLLVEMSKVEAVESSVSTQESDVTWVQSNINSLSNVIDNVTKVKDEAQVSLRLLSAAHEQQKEYISKISDSFLNGAKEYFNNLKNATIG